MAISLLARRIGAPSPAPAYRLLLCHATGFCKETWKPLLEDLHQDMLNAGISGHAVALDFSGHGDSRPAAAPNRWETFCPTDIGEAITNGFPPACAAPFVGIGHSMGAAGLCLAEISSPGLFSKLFLVEPIIPNLHHAKQKDKDMFQAMSKYLSDGAARRRGAWASLEEAQAYLRSRPLLAGWDPRVREAYIEGGVRISAADSPRCELKCSPAVEAQIYTPSESRDIVSQLAAIKCPATVFGGKSSNTFAAEHWAYLAAHLPRGQCQMVDGSHFWPMEAPAALAHSIVGQLAGGAHL